MSKRKNDDQILLSLAERQIKSGELAEAGQYLNKVLATPENRLNWLVRAKALNLRSAIHRLNGNLLNAQKDIEQAVRIASNKYGTSDILGKSYRRLGEVKKERGRFKEAVRDYKKALQLYADSFDLNTIGEIYNSLGAVYGMLGEMNLASTHFDNAICNWRKAKNQSAEAMALNNIANVYHKRGQYQMALDAYNQGLDKTRATGYQRIEACIMISIAEVWRDAGYYEKAVQQYHKGLDKAQMVMEPYYSMWAKAGLGETYRRIGKPNRAKILLEETICELETRGKKYEAALFRICLGAVECDLRDFQKSTDLLTRSLGELSRFGDNDGLAHCCFHLARTYFNLKRFDICSEYLNKTANLANRLGYNDFLAVEGRHAGPLIQYASELNIGGHHFSEALMKLKRKEIPLGESSRYSVRHGDFDIEAYGFGNSRVVVSGCDVTVSDWRSSRAKELFFYLLCHPSGRTKEQITSAIWPDFSPTRASSNLHTSSHRARRALFPNIITVDNGVYRICTITKIRFDVLVFQRLTREAFTSRERDCTQENNLKEAINLYEGPFLNWCYSEWAEELRRDLEDSYLKALYELAKLFAEKGDYQAAITLLEKRIGIDPYDEDCHSLLIDFYLKSGDRASAQRRYKQYLNKVSIELDLDANIRFRNLVQR